ncbi:MAG TPA: apolipoprotein N-acyltransferase [Holophagaceae bacterium]
MKPWLLRPLEALTLGLVFVLAFRFPGALGGWLEPAAALLFPLLLLEAAFRGRHALWLGAALLAGLVLLFYWVPATLESKGGLPWSLALLGGALFYAWEALGFLLAVLFSRWLFRRSGAVGAAFGAALGILVWEAWGFHIYPWSWGAAFGALPWTARSAAFLTTRGLSALAWGAGAWAAAARVQGAPARRFLAPLGTAVAAIGLLGLAWRALPRGAERRLDVALVQPNFPAGLRWPGMEAEMWRRSDALLARAHLPRPGRATLLLWPESSVLGRDDRQPDPRLREEAARRGVAWLYGTEGGPYNLVRGEAAGRPDFIFAKVEPMPFGERMPGPPWLRHWLDAKMGFISQEPGRLEPGDGFAVPGSGGVTVAPLICSEALDPERAREGLALGGADLLSNHTNDGWFDRSIATDLHAAQIRLRPVELGVPLVRATLTGKSGVFREDGRFQLWGAPLSEGAWTLALDWRPVHTPARSPWLLRILAAALALGALLVAWNPSSRKA